jgi:ABC-type uncharacterized transport system auxiliary subunit
MSRILLIAYAVILLAGCAGSGPVREDAFYRLDPLPAMSGVAVPLEGTVLVSAITGRSFAGGRNIVFWDAAQPETIQRYTYHFWVEPPAVLIHDVITQAFRDARLAERVVTPTQRVRADYIVSGTLLRMEHRRESGGSKVLIEMELGLLRTATRDLVTLKRYTVEEAAVDNQIGSAVSAFGRALGRLVALFLEDVQAG